MWRRSVSRARRSARASRRAGRLSLRVIDSSSAATPRRAARRPTRGAGRRRPPTRRRRRWRPARPTSRRTHVRAAARTRVDDDGRSSASRSASHSVATGVRTRCPPRRSRPARRPRRARRGPARPGGWWPRGRRCGRAAPVRRDRRILGSAARRPRRATTAGRRCRRRGRRRSSARRIDCSAQPRCGVAATRPSSRWTTRTRSAAGRRTVQPRLLVGVGGAHGAVLDARVAERDPVEQGVVGVDETPGRCASCGRASRVVAPLGRVEVGVHVGAAERVDRLLRIADQHERRGAVAERRADDVPLHRVGVLELVDHHDPEALPQPCRRPPAADRVAQRACEPGEQVVVGEDRRRRLRRSTSSRTATARRRRIAGAVAGSTSPARARLPGLNDRASADAHGHGEVERRRRSGELAQVEVVDDLVDEVGQVLDERDVARRRRRRRRGRRAPAGRSRGWWRSSPRRSRRGRWRDGGASLDQLVGVGPAARRREDLVIGRAASHRRGRGEPASAVTSRSRTRSRSSPVAIRPNVTSSMRSSGVPSAT